jgi:DNA repair exonuclease SbcCD ATPase subunit
MNMILKQKLKTIDDELKDIAYKIELTSEKIHLKENYIEDLKENKKKLLDEKKSSISTNEKEIVKKKKIIDGLKKISDDMTQSISDSIEIKTRFDKLKVYQTTLKEKHKAHSTNVTFFENSEDCPTCQQHIDEEFKTNMIDKKKAEADKVQIGLDKMKNSLDLTELKICEITNIVANIQKNSIEIAKENSSIVQLEKFNSTLQTETENLNMGHIENTDYTNLNNLKEQMQSFVDMKSKLREDKTYAEASKNMLQDTGIKTKIIKQYLPIMNKLINTYLTSMEFYVNFTLDENFEETIKSRYRDDFSYSSFSEGEKMRIDLALLFTWRAIAKMKNSTNTNLLILDEIFDSSLDGTGTDEFLKILNTLGDENVFVISHKQDALADKFRNTIKFEKIRNFSHVIIN